MYKLVAKESMTDRKKLDSEKYFDVHQAAEFLKVHPGTIRRWANNKKLPGRKIGSRGDWRFTEEDLDTMLSGQKKPKKNRTSTIYKLFELSPSPFIVLKGREGKFEFINEAAAKLMPKSDIVGMPMYKAFPEAKGKGWLEPVNQVFTTGKAVTKQKKPASGKWGDSGKVTTKYFNVMYAPIMNNDGGVEGVMITGSDVTEEVHQQKEADKAQSVYEKLADSLPVMVWFTDEQGKCKYLNKRWCDYTGEKPEAGYEDGWLDFIHPEDIGIFQSKFNVAKQQHKSFDLEYRLRGQDGNYRWFLDATMPMMGDDGAVTGYISTVLDIHKRKLTESALQEQHSFFENLAETIPQIAYIAESNGDIIYYSNQWYEYIGGVEGTEGWGWIEAGIYHAEDLEHFVARWKESLDTGEPFECEYRLRRHDGKYRWYLGRALPVRDENGEITHWFGTKTDIHHQKEVEKIIKESADELRFMAEAMPQKVFALKPDGTPEYLNPQWEKYTGKTKEELHKMDWFDLVYPDDRKRLSEEWERSMKTGSPLYFEHRLKRYDGKCRWHVRRVHAMRNEAGKIIKWIGSDTDVHDIRRALAREEALERRAADLSEQRAQLVELNRAKDDFISLASHQLRTPASGVKQYLGMVLQGYAGELQTEQLSMIDRAFASNERQLAIIEDLLRIARIDSGKFSIKPTTTPIEPLLQEVITNLRPYTQKRRQTVQYKCQYSNMTVNVDPDKFRMVLENLVDNASKYSFDSSNIEIFVSRQKRYINVHIKDNGVGISEKEIGKLFKKFSRLNNELSVKVGGTGLGLYFAKRVIDLHGGDIIVKSTPANGSTFTIKLPRN